MRLFIISMIAMSPLVLTASGDQDTLRDMARSHKGNVEVIQRREYGPAALLEVVKESDAGARVVVMDEGRGILSEDERSIESEYTVQVLEQLFGRRAFKPAEHIVVTKPGGTVVLDQYKVVAREPDFPPFEHGDEYILFLKRDESSGRYMVAYGAQGAFKHVASSVEQVSKIGLWKQERGTVDISEFISEVKAVASQVQGQP
jgi:hypothetical protein